MKKSLFLLFILFVQVAGYSQTITGTVVDSLSGKPLEGANIIHPESQKGTTSDQKGNFSLSLPGHDGHVVVSFVGYESKKIPVKSLSGTKKYRIVLHATTQTTSEIVVSASDNRIRYDAPARIERITMEEIENSPSSGIDLMLNYIPGVQVNRDFGIFSDNSVVSLRGLGGDSQKRTLVCLDGLPLNKSDGGSINWNLVNMADIENIDVVKGPASAMYGNKAMGGVINMVSAPSPRHLVAKMDAGYGTYDTKWAGAYFGNTLTVKDKPAFSYSINARYRDSNGYIVEPKDYIAEYDSIVVPLYLKEWNIGGGLTYIHGQSKYDFSFTHYDDNRGRGTRVFERDGAFSSHLTNRGSLRYSFEKEGVEIRVMAFNQQENYFRTTEYLHEGEYKLYDVDAVRVDRGVASMIVFDTHKNHKFTAGLSLDQRTTDGVDLYYTSTDKITNRGKMASLGTFVQEKILLFNETIELYAGLRYDLARFYDGSFAIENPSYSIQYLQDFSQPDYGSPHWDAINPKLSLQYSLHLKLSVYASWGSGFTAPLLEDLCRSGMKSNEFQLANPYLGPEKIKSTELGFKWNIIPKLDIDFSVYSSTGIDFMYSVNTGDSVNLGYKIVPVKQIQNIYEVLIQGMEGSLNYQFMRQIKISVSYSQSDSEIKKYVADMAIPQLNLTGKHLAEEPDKNLSCKLFWNHPVFQVMIQAKYTGERWINELNSLEQLYLNARKYPSYLLVDAQVSAKIRPEITLRLKLENLFDEIYINSKGQRNPGRFITLSAEWKFLNQNKKNHY